jgi:hypothetical protein
MCAGGGCCVESTSIGRRGGAREVDVDDARLVDDAGMGENARQGWFRSQCVCWEGWQSMSGVYLSMWCCRWKCYNLACLSAAVIA